LLINKIQPQGITFHVEQIIVNIKINLSSRIECLLIYLILSAHNLISQIKLPLVKWVAVISNRCY